MSGPKTSHYTLTPEQRRILEEHRKIRIEREWLEKQKRDIRSVLAEADQIITQIELLYVETKPDTDTVLHAKKLRTVVITAFNQATDESDGEGSERLRELNQILRSNTKELAFVTQGLKVEQAAADKAFRAEMADRIDGGFDFSFDTVGDTSDIARDPYSKKIEAELDGLAELTLTGEQSARAEAIRAKLNDIDDPEFLKNFYAMTVRPFAKECQAYWADYAIYGEEYERKRFIYEVNAQKLGIAPECIPFSAEAISLLDVRIRETEEVIRQQEEQAYISRCVDEAMQEMGYAVVGSREVVRRSGKRFRNELYLFDEGTAVNVTYSSDGQITMELGGIGNDDRLPTETESASLASDMRTFCDDYHEIEQRLLKKGIVTKKISVLPPDAQYAQIINVSDYNLSVPVSEYEAKETRKRTAETKSKRMGG